MPGPDVRADHGADLADRDLPPGEVRPAGVGQVLGQRARPGPGWRGARPRRRPGGRPAAATASSSSRPSARAAVRTFSRVADPAVDDLQQRLDREGRAEQRGRGADPAAAAEVLQRVDVEQRRRRRRRGPARRPRPPRPSRRASSTSAARARRTRSPCPSCRVSTARTGIEASPRRELRGLEGAAHLPRQVHRQDLRRRRPPLRLLVGLEEHRRGRPRGADRRPLAQRGGDRLRGRLGVDALVVRPRADHHLQRARRVMPWRSARRHAAAWPWSR